MTSLRCPMPIPSAFAAGTCTALSWAPWNCWPIALPGYAFLCCLLWCAPSAGRAAAIAFAFGVGLHGVGHGWLFGTLFNTAYSGWMGASIGGILTIAILALFTALPGLAWRLYRNTQPVRALSFAALLTLGEYARSLLFNGVTGLSLGYALVDSPAAGWTPVLGVYGVSFLAYLAAALLYRALANRTEANTLFLVAALLVLINAGLILQAHQWVEPDGAALRFRLVQSPIRFDDKFNDVEKFRHIERTIALMEQAPADLVVTPETAFPLLLNQLPQQSLARLQHLARKDGSHLFVGIVVPSAEGDGYNGMLHLSPRNEAMTQYRKLRLMPFGEYTPTGFGWYGALLHIPFKNLRAGTSSGSPFMVDSQVGMPTQRIAVLLCQEDEAGAALLPWLPQSSVFINPADLSGFTGTGAIEQGLQRVRTRALEAGRPILRVANGGITAQIDHRGTVQAQLPSTSTAVLAGAVQGMQGRTPFARFGNAPILAICVLILVVSSTLRIEIHRRARRILNGQRL
jgi:apolipoprotein N-acyltransferase